jgi:hypothetical protein
MIPCSGQVLQDGSEVSVTGQQSGYVFEEDFRRLDCLDTFESFRPGVALVLGGELLSTVCEWLAWEASGQDINQALVAFSVSTANKFGDTSTIDGSIFENPVADSLRENAASVGFALDISERSPSEQLAGEQAAAATGKE